MTSLGEPRQVKRLAVPEIGEVRQHPDSELPFSVLDAAGARIMAYERFLADTYAANPVANTIYAYAHDLLRADRFFNAIGVHRDNITRTDVSDLFRWMRVAPVRQRRRTVNSRKSAPGSTNRRTGRRYLPRTYSRSTLLHQETVLRTYWNWRVENDLALANPVPIKRFRSQNQSSPLPREIPDRHLEELFAALTNMRDWLIVYLMLWSGPRSSEAINITLNDIHPDDSVVYIARKGQGGVKTVVPCVAVFFEFLDRYLDELAERSVYLDPDEPIWRTLIGEDRPINYGTVQKAFERANDKCGFNYTLHDLRHTCAHRLNADPDLTLTDVQAILGHRSPQTTARYTTPTISELVRKVAAHHEKAEQRRSEAATIVPDQNYDTDGLNALFGWDA